VVNRGYSLRRLRISIPFAALALLAAAAPARAVEPVTLLAAGDIAGCNSLGDEATAAILDVTEGTVATLGDNAYPDGTPTQFAECYHPSWGRHRARTRPAVGNHEYRTPGAAGYFGYFGAAAGDPTKGYYSYDLGAWHVVVLNSQCWEIGGCEAGSPQERWLRADLAASTAPCTVAYWHHARFSSARWVQLEWMEPAWKALYEHGAELVLAGHDHVYERHAPQTPSGDPSPAFGLRQFVVGSGGFDHHRFVTALPTSEVAESQTFGLLALTLRDDGYDWQFLPEAGRSFVDAGSGQCHAPPPDTTSPTVALTGDTTLARGEVVLSADAADDGALARVEFLVDGTVVAQDTTAPYSVAWDSTTVADGLRLLVARAVDAWGNPTNSSGRQILIDNALPETRISAGPAPYAPSRTARFAFGDEPGASYECALDRAPFAPCATPVRLEGLSAGRHTFRVRARDAAGNLELEPAFWAWIVDVTRPQTTVLLARLGRAAPARVLLEFESPDPVATFSCSLDRAAWTPCASPTTYEALAPGSHELRVRALDLAGNADWTPVRRTWRVGRAGSGEIVWASEDADVVVGTRGDDEIHALGGDDLVRGLGGNDVLDGGTGSDRLDGGPGDDAVRGGLGRDILLGGPGRDRLDALDGTRDVVRGGRGRDSGRVDRRLDDARGLEPPRRAQPSTKR
jgi:Bacterial Ig domain/RTX calcium-binding nonapeptide repeat (4 copies)/Calcineurin-like phosphoesterase